MTQRLDELTGPVEIGKHYYVPTVEAEWYGRIGVWPVIGPKHNNARCLNFDHQHYHPDPRFIGPRRSEDDWKFWRYVAGAPIMTSEKLNRSGLPKPVWRRRKCLRLANPFIARVQGLVATNGNWRCLLDEWTGKQARHDGRGWVCPHRAVPLADHAPVDGVITCPLHMLRIDAATGIVLPPIGEVAR
jgi:hypothetical protein